MAKKTNNFFHSSLQIVGIAYTFTTQKTMEMACDTPRQYAWIRKPPLDYIH